MVSSGGKAAHVVSVEKPHMVFWAAAFWHAAS